MYETTKTEPTRVTVTLGYTVNMGNYESLRVDVSISDSARSDESATTAFNRVYAFTEKQLMDKVTEIRQEMETGTA